MKKIFVLSALMLAFISASAQFNLGIKAGYTSSLGLGNLSSAATGGYTLNDVKADLGNNFHVGAFGRIGFGKMYIQPELLYMVGKKDYTLSVADAQNSSIITSVDKHVKVSAVDIPLLIGYKVLDLKLMNLRLFAGPKFSFDAGSTLSYDNLKGGGFSLSELEQDILKSRIGLEAGFGADVLMFTLDFRYSFINDMHQTKLKDLTLDKIPHNNFVISLGWKIL